MFEPDQIPSDNAAQQETQGPALASIDQVRETRMLAVGVFDGLVIMPNNHKLTDWEQQLSPAPNTVVLLNKKTGGKLTMLKDQDRESVVCTALQTDRAAGTKTKTTITLDAFTPLVEVQKIQKEPGKSAELAEIEGDIPDFGGPLDSDYCQQIHDVLSDIQTDITGQTDRRSRLGRFLARQ